MILCWATFEAILGHVLPRGCGLDAPYVSLIVATPRCCAGLRTQTSMTLRWAPLGWVPGSSVSLYKLRAFSKKGTTVFSTSLLLEVCIKDKPNYTPVRIPLDYSDASTVSHLTELVTMTTAHSGGKTDGKIAGGTNDYKGRQERVPCKMKELFSCLCNWYSNRWKTWCCMSLVCNTLKIE